MKKEREEMCRQWQQLRDEITRMEELHKIQKVCTKEPGLPPLRDLEEMVFLSWVLKITKRMSPYNLGIYRPPVSTEKIWE